MTPDKGNNIFPPERLVTDKRCFTEFSTKNVSIHKKAYISKMIYFCKKSIQNEAFR